MDGGAATALAYAVRHPARVSHIAALGCWARGRFARSRTIQEPEITETDPRNIMNTIVVAYKPMVQGSTADNVGGFFTDIWRCWSQPAPGDRMEFLIQTTPTSKSRYLKNSFGMDSLITVKQNELAFSKIEKWVKGKL